MTRIIVVSFRINTTDLNYEKFFKKTENRNLENFIFQEIKINYVNINFSVS